MDVIRKIPCSGVCCTQENEYSPSHKLWRESRNVIVPTAEGPLTVHKVLRHNLRLAYGMQPRKLSWEVEASAADGVVFSCEIVCTACVRCTRRAG